MMFLRNNDTLQTYYFSSMSLNRRGKRFRVLTQVHIFGFSLASLDIRQESTRHSDAIQELTNYLELPKQYDQMSEKERMQWLNEELNTKRPLIPSEVNWNKSTEETFSVFKMVKRLQEEFGSRICHSYVHFHFDH